MGLSPIKGSNTLIRIKEKKTITQPSRTYEFDWNTMEFTGQMIDQKQALEQFARKALATPRFNHLIYSAKYGSEIEEQMGEDVTLDFLESEIPRLVTEALIYDERVKDCVDFVITKEPESDKVFVDFTLVSTDGFIIRIEEVTV